MTDKKSDDFVLRMPDGHSRVHEQHAFPSNGSPRAGRPVAAPASQFFSSIEGSGGASVLAYCLSSISMTLVNKYVVSGRQWNLHLLYLAIQSIVGTSTIIVCKHLGMIKDLDPFDSGRAQRWFPISLLLVGMIFTGNKALQFLSVPVYTIFKNLTIIVIAYGEVLWFGGSVSPLTLVSFGLMVSSSVLAAWADFHHVTVAVPGALQNASSAAAATLSAGYAWMGLNVLCSALYVLSMRKAIKITNLKNWDVMFYNNLLTVPVLILSSLLIEDWSSTNLHNNFPPESRHSLLVGMVYSGLAAIFISYCTAWCIRATSSTTYAMSGALNKLPMAIAGLVFFADPITFGSVSAIILGFISGLIYTWAKNRRSQPPGLPSAVGRSASGTTSPNDKGPAARA
ncbi:UAA transporter family protein [Hirsutella rhossiliensis]|uniref:GDP-mannose transporter n=1 Tax=Hirsutella rhossiliensis TaxID=111463 RepID=A0A9P8N523_9HYPO|nr:UAA transporter family domain-containing protein [Hirsutella rhossiliensis]KAH0968603.1 UAA transporter family domain-containing protein [Hirsutella rhossiliensis]